MMKRYSFGFLVVTLSFFLISWGSTGHRTVGQIAENHLTPQAKEAIKNLIGKESLADISNWADEVRSDPAFKNTAGWHYVNLPGGLTYEQFANAVNNMPPDNGYKAILQCERILTDPQKAKGQKIVALKYLVHFIGDLHQPMHVSHAEDKGGNSIVVDFFNGTSDNLHGLWDSGLIEHQHSNYKDLAQAYDTATPEQITKWQTDPPMLWIWESYQISSILYTEVAENNKLGEDYYQEHIPVVQKQIAKAGIRLAGQLNAIFK
jgi:hypothetical protein